MSVELADTARRLRKVKDAYRDFLVLWAFENVTSDRAAMARVASDVEAALADPHDHNWSLLYRGSILDD